MWQVMIPCAFEPRGPGMVHHQRQWYEDFHIGLQNEDRSDKKQENIMQHKSGSAPMSYIRNNVCQVSVSLHNQQCKFKSVWMD